MYAPCQRRRIVTLIRTYCKGKGVYGRGKKLPIHGRLLTVAARWQLPTFSITIASSGAKRVDLVHRLQAPTDVLNTSKRSGITRKHTIGRVCLRRGLYGEIEGIAFDESA